MSIMFLLRKHWQRWRLFFEQEEQSTRVQNRTVENHEIYVANKKTRMVGDSIDVRFHVINFDNNQGFALVSADSRTTSIYAYSTTGHLDMEDAIANTGFGDFMEDATEFYKEEIINGKVIPGEPEPIDTMHIKYKDIPMLPLVEIDGEEYHMAFKSDTLYNVGKMLSVEWHQDFPYNYYCPSIPSSLASLFPDLSGKAAVGCAPLAAGQIFSYYQKPLSALGYSFDWASIMSSPSYVALSPASLATAHLLRAIGDTMESVYGVETSTYNSKLNAAYQSYGYMVTGPVAMSTAILNSSLANSHPVHAIGYNGNGGHSWVIDGVISYTNTTTYYYSYPPYNMYKRSSTSSCYYHCNYGVRYLSNTWCIDAFGHFGNDKQILYDIYPAD